MNSRLFTMEEMTPKARIGVAFTELDNRHELHGGLIRPATGSGFRMELDIEPNEASYVRSSTYIAASREHLTAAQYLWGNRSFRDLGVSSLSTVLRTALLSYARTAWLLAPDDPRERIARSCALHIEDLSRELDVSVDLQKDPEPLQMLGDDALKRLNHEVDHHRKMIRSIKERHTKYAPLSKVTDTDRIRHASRMVASGDEAANIRAALLSAWRHSSGHAHGLTWTRTRNVVGIEREGPHWRGLAQPDLEQISLLAIGTAMVGIKALDRVGELSVGPGAAAFGYRSPARAF